MQAGLLYLFYDIPRALNRLLIVSLASILQAFSLLLLDGAHQRLRRTSRAWYLVFITLNSKAVDCNHGAPHTLREYCKNRQVTYLPTTKNFRGIGFVIQRVTAGRAIRHHLRPHPTPAPVRRPLRYNVPRPSRDPACVRGKHLFPVALREYCLVLAWGDFDGCSLLLLLRTRLLLV